MSTKTTSSDQPSTHRNSRDNVSDEIFQMPQLMVRGHNWAEIPLQTGGQESHMLCAFNAFLQQRQGCLKRIFSTGDNASLQDKTGRVNTPEQVTLAVIPVDSWPAFLDMEILLERVVNWHVSPRIAQARTIRRLVSRALPVSNTLGGLT